MNAQVIDFDYLAFMLGGTNTAGTISVTSEVVSVGFKCEGTLRVKMHGTNEIKILDVVMYNMSPQVSADLTLSATEVTTFPLTFDLMADADGKILDIKEHVAPAGN